MKDALLSYLAQSGEAILSYYRKNPPFSLAPGELAEGTFAYFERGGKRLRPAICRLSAGIFGGDKAQEDAVPCALALELYHNWTLIHDDMIDHDDTRRGKSAVHKLVFDRCAPFGEERAKEYGYDVALMAGDALHSAAVYYLSRLSETGAVPPEVTLKILSLLEGEYGPRLISGETLDTRNGVLYGAGSFYRLSREDVLTMMEGKTAALFGISALSGALIGLKKWDAEDERAKNITSFAENCGVAFQLQDDILGVVSTEKVLGKPIGSDIREGKPTVLLLSAYENATSGEKDFLRRVVGSSREEDEIARAREILLSRGLEETHSMALSYLDRAKHDLEKLPDGPEKDLLEAWRAYMLNREM